MNKLTHITAALTISAAFGCGSALDRDARSAHGLQADDLITDVPPAVTEVPDDSADGAPRTELDCPGETADCEFTTYNLDVRVGDTFILANFVDCGGIAADFVFGYEDGEDWNIDAFNNDELVTIVEADLQGGNKSDGRYRLSIFDANGEEIDHMTIRIDHADESDVDARHAVPIVRPTPTADGLCYSEDPRPSGEPSVPQ